MQEGAIIATSLVLYARISGGHSPFSRPVRAWPISPVLAVWTVREPPDSWPSYVFIACHK